MEEGIALSRDPAIDALRYVMIDTEFTSLDQRSNRLLSVGAIAMQGTSIRLGEQFYRMVNPEVEIPEESVVVHQIRSQDLEGAEAISVVLDELGQFIRGAVLVGHFARLDLGILKKEATRTGHTFSSPAIDTARVHQWLLRNGPYTEDLPQRLEKLDLETVAKSYDVDPQNTHHALGDAFFTARVWQKMLASLQARGVKDLKKLLKIGAAK